MVADVVGYCEFRLAVDSWSLRERRYVSGFVNVSPTGGEEGDGLCMEIFTIGTSSCLMEFCTFEDVMKFKNSFYEILVLFCSFRCRAAYCHL